uniref:Uncharacterized protein n=1 Tax=Rhizophora mucronata TaxID=61149 RepID=A0A2P2NUG6_RHIMU
MTVRCSVANCSHSSKYYKYTTKNYNNQ